MSSLDTLSPTRGLRPSEILERYGPVPWTMFTDPTLDEELKLMNLLVQLVERIPVEDRREMLIGLGLRFGVPISY